MKVLKFWWTSVWNSKMIKITANIIYDSKKDEDIVVVVSAMSWVTNSLIEICDLVKSWNHQKVLDFFYVIKNKHSEVAIELIWDKYLENNYFLKLGIELDNLENILKRITLLKSITEKSKAKILYFWEVFSSILVSLAVNNFWVKSNNYLSKDLLMCEWLHLIWECNFEKSNKFISKWIKNIDLKNEIPIITWFWWWDKLWDVYLFDRWWSDYVWSLVWRFLQADSIEIWTDVDWIMSADPRIVDNPILWEELDYALCAEFALVWAKVLHPKTISPAQEKNIPVFIKNTFNPLANWTKICKKFDKWLKWISIEEQQIIINFVDPTMIWWYWYIYDAVKIFNDEKISIDAVATNEISFSLSIKSKHFSQELYNKFLVLKEKLDINIYKNITKVSIVWDTINDSRILSYFDDEIVMITSWAYWKSLTVFVKNDDSKELLVKLHSRVFWR